MTVFSHKNHNQRYLNISEDILQEISLTKSEQLLKLIVHNSSSAICFSSRCANSREGAFAIAVLDRQLRYLMFSPQWLQDYNLKFSQVIGCHYADVFTKQFESEQPIIQECLVKGISQQIKQTVTDDHQITKHFQLLIYPWYSQKNQIEGVIIFSELLNSELTVEPFSISL